MKQELIFKVIEIKGIEKLLALSTEVNPSADQYGKSYAFDWQKPSKNNPAIFVGAFSVFTDELLGYLHLSVINSKIPNRYFQSFPFLDYVHTETAILQHIEVKPESRRMYIAHELLQYAIAWAKDKYDEMYLLGMASYNDTAIHHLFEPYGAIFSKRYSHSSQLYENFYVSL